MSECVSNNNAESSSSMLASDAEKTTEIIVSSSSTPASQNTNVLWNRFLKQISSQRQGERGSSKYPNPDVPEFYPRHMRKSVVSTQESAIAVTDDEDVKTFRSIAKLHLPPTADESSKGLVRYYRTIGDIPEFVPRWWQLNPTSPSTPCATNVQPPSQAMAAVTALTFDELNVQLSVKNQQLAHMNDIVKALFDEIWRINEQSTSAKTKEQWRNETIFAVDEFLKPSAELGFHCDDCCDRLKDFVARVSKQLERRMSKQLHQYRNEFVDRMLTVVENSLYTLDGNASVSKASNDLRSKLLKLDVHTQTEPSLMGSGAEMASRAAETGKNRYQITKIYRNNNFYKRFENRPKDGSSRNQHSKSTVPIRSSVQQQQTFAFDEATAQNALLSVNPIQTLHQKYKNLNCRVEGIPDKNLIKFTYVVNGKEYSTVASTKKEAQHHCAWHVLNANPDA